MIYPALTGGKTPTLKIGGRSTARNRFYQMFNETKPQMFNVFRQFEKIAEELMHAAEKFRNADELYDGNLVEGNLSDKNFGSFTRSP